MIDVVLRLESIFKRQTENKCKEDFQRYNDVRFPADR